MRKTVLAIGEYYHVFNRGVDKRQVFLGKKDYVRFLEAIRFVNNQKTYFGLSDYKRSMNCSRPEGSVKTDPSGLGDNPPLVSIICYCLNPNHYHLILKQESENGISLFMGKLSNSYTKYFNQKYDRSGSLFQGPFKSVHIENNKQLLYLSVYVNANNFIHKYSKNYNWPYSSLLDYIGKRNGKLCKKENVLGQFKNRMEYFDFIKKTANYLKDKKEWEKYVLE